ncbi:MAG: hypothetical protein MJA30_12380, partial [Cytophagales bacterium]|nr:hypothetical protein [Cytophagales bacterium]
HVLPTNGIVQLECLPPLVGHFQEAKVIHRAPTLVGDVVQDEQTPRILQLAVVAVVGLGRAGGSGKVQV